MNREQRRTIGPVITRLSPAVLMTGMTLLVSGCQTAGFFANVIGGGEKIDALYEPADRPLVVMVDDSAQNPKLPSRDLALRIADRVSRDFEQQEIVQQVVDCTLVADLAAREADFAKWPIDRIGKQVGAEQVLYIVVDAFRLTEDDAIFRPFVQVRVKIIDATTGERLFPGDDSGVTVVAQLNYSAMDGANATTHRILSERLAEQLADEISKLFYRHKAPEPGDRLPG